MSRKACKYCIHYILCFPNSGAYGFKLKPCTKFKDKADYTEVVRCKDCKHRHIPTRCALWYGTVDNKQYFVERGDNFSCSYGERSDKNAL
jgi:hypothetical protein